MLNKLKWDYSVVCEFLVYCLHQTGSLSTVLSSHYATCFFWRLGSDEPCPSESNYVSLFIKGLQRKYKLVPKKAFPISYGELSTIFSKIVGDSDIESLSFVKLCFITMILTLYSSFARFEEIIKLTLSDVVLEDSFLY